jgi:hypothetical protein
MPYVLEIHLTRISPTHHRPAYVRPDGTGETIELETRSCLYHDLLHFAVETEAGLTKSFYGHLARARSYAELGALDATFREEVGLTERIVGVFTGAFKTNAEPDVLLANVKNMQDALGEPIPAWLTEEFVSRVKERMRRLIGEWNGTPFGNTMRLEFRLR